MKADSIIAVILIIIVFTTLGYFAGRNLGECEMSDIFYRGYDRGREDAYEVTYPYAVNCGSSYDLRFPEEIGVVYQERGAPMSQWHAGRSDVPMSDFVTYYWWTDSTGDIILTVWNDTARDILFRID